MSFSVSTRGMPKYSLENHNAHSQVHHPYLAVPALVVMCSNIFLCQCKVKNLSRTGPVPSAWRSSDYVSNPCPRFSN